MKHFGDGQISENDNHLPLKSTEGNMAVKKYDTMQMNEIEVDDNTSSDSDDQRFFDQTDDLSYLCNRTTAITKLQVRLNDIINNHKASLKIHDDIVNIFNEYITSLNFDKYAKLKTRKSFIQSMETSLNVTHLRPKPIKVTLHDGSEHTIVPVFDAKAMIFGYFDK